MSYSSTVEFQSLGIQGQVVNGYESEAQDALDAAQGTMHGYFRAADPPFAVPVPTAAVDLSIKQYECWLAALPFMSARGFDPGSDPDSIIVTNYKLAMAWLKDVQARKTIPYSEPASTDPNLATAGFAVETDAPRGW